jgi:ubiquinone/menaquinone biosynthesis C-methylase UbiE
LTNGTISQQVPERVGITSLTQLDDLRYVQDIKRYEFAAKFSMDSVVIDISCGTGYGAYLLAERGGATHVIGVDLSSVALSTATISWQGDKNSFVLGDGHCIPLKNASVDLVVSFETLEHVNNPLNFLLELKRIAKPNGKIIVSTPQNESELRFTPSNPHHVREYNHSEFTSLINSVFVDEKIEIFSQVTQYSEDMRLVALNSPLLGGGIVRKIARALLSKSMRAILKRKLSIRDLGAQGSSIHEGFLDTAHVQIAVITVGKSATCIY